MSEENPPQAKKTIFVISPINKKDEEGFDFTELFFKEIVEPAAEAAGGFDAPIRADRVSKPGSITAQVVSAIIKADVCVADLTGRNPNVMYEVAIAHAADKPVILLQQESGGPPFDFTDERTIHYTTRADKANIARNELVKHLKNAGHEEFDQNLRRTLHPVRQIFQTLKATEGATDLEQVILDRIEALSADVQRLAQKSEAGRLTTVKNEKDDRFELLLPIVNGEPNAMSPWDIDELISLTLTHTSEGLVKQLKDHIDGGSPDWIKLKNIHLKLLEISKNKPDDKRLQNQNRIGVKDLITSLPPF